MKSLTILTTFKSPLLPLSFPSPSTAKHIMIPTAPFTSQSAFDTDWNYLYAWGTDHNGAARMANPNGEKPASHGGKQIPIRYLSGAVHAKEHFNVSSGGGYDFSGEFKATTARGT
ncbi:hypothetical protein VTI74DRAFT_2901 [Chaetomium olivicolor]